MCAKNDAELYLPIGSVSMLISSYLDNHFEKIMKQTPLALSLKISSLYQELAVCSAMFTAALVTDSEIGNLSCQING